MIQCPMNILPAVKAFLRLIDLLNLMAESGENSQKFSLFTEKDRDMNIFEFAMEKEKYSEDYYRQLAGKSNNKGLETVFNMLADEEAKHYRIVSEMKDEVAADLAETTVLSDAKDVFEKMRGSARNFDFDISQTELYRKAQNIEKQSRDFYLEKANEVSGMQKEIFLKLADEERKHYFLLENVIDFVSRPETWLENAEFYHLDEY
jgi:rubrerythrin